MMQSRQADVIVEISDQRLPARMVVQRIRMNLRDAAPVVRPHLPARRGSLATAMAITLVALLTPARLRHAS
jgi:hypothetical protein